MTRSCTAKARWSAKCPATNGSASPIPRAYLAFMWAHPGKKLLFMGQEFGQTSEWNCNEAAALVAASITRPHQGLQTLVRDLNRFYAFASLDARARLRSRGLSLDRRQRRRAIGARLPAHRRAGRSRRSRSSAISRRSFGATIASACRSEGRWVEALNTDSSAYWGSNVGNLGGVKAERRPMHGFGASASVTLPPLRRSLSRIRTGKIADGLRLKRLPTLEEA